MRLERLELSRLAAPDPKSGVSAISPQTQIVAGDGLEPSYFFFMIKNVITFDETVTMTVHWNRRILITAKIFYLTIPPYLCIKRDSNSHITVTSYRLLRPVCLPIPPPMHMRFRQPQPVLYIDNFLCQVSSYVSRYCHLYIPLRI